MLIIISAWFWGDPHIGTFDGLQYTFNGRGEYILITTNEVGGFEVQGRASIATDASLNPINATVFSAFVGEESSSGAKVQVELSDDFSRMYILHPKVLKRSTMAWASCNWIVCQSVYLSKFCPFFFNI